MKFKRIILINFLLTVALSQNQTYKLQYISPDDLIESLGLKEKSNQGYYYVHGDSPVYIHMNQSNNHVRMAGTAEGSNAVLDLIHFYDVPPKQIIIEVKMIEINNQQLNDIGMDWQNLLEKLSLNVSLDADKTLDDSEAERSNDGYTDETTYKTTRTALSSRLSFSSLALSDLLNILSQKEIGKVVNSPRIVTTNNQLGSILDGEHLTYVTRYSSYSNLYETEELNSGLSLEVTPSLGQSGYMTLDIEAKYTYISGTISGSPVEKGQILKSNVIVKNEEPFLLGSFKQVGSQTIKRKVPILGTILPYIFSKKIDVEIEKNILVILTPHVIDLEGSDIPEVE